MNNWIKRLCTAAFFPVALTCILLALWLFPPAVPVDNITPAEDIISREYSLERLLLTKAIFDVRHGFEEVTAQQLARETGVLLECRRQITERQYYYVVEGCGYQCFLFADEDDILYDAMIFGGFASQADVKDIIADLENVGIDMTVDETSQFYLRDNYRVVKHVPGIDYLYFPLADGVMIMSRPTLYNHEAEPQYYFYSDADWPAAEAEWKDRYGMSWSNPYNILPIDKTAWPK